MKLSRDVWLAIGLFVILALITAVSIYQQAKDEITPPPLASFSSDSNGAKALSLWLEELNYRVYSENPAAFSIPDDTNVIFMLEPTEPILETEWQTVDEWIEEGGTLLLVGNQLYTNLAFSHFEFDTNRPTETTTALQTPLFTSPPQTETEQVRARTYLSSERTDFVTHLAEGGNPVVVSFAQGDGQVILATVPFTFSNEGLKAAGNPELVLNLISIAGQPGHVWFDEWHHGQRGVNVEPLGPAAWLRQTPGGRALIYAAVVLLIALLLQGRAFGRPVPLPDNTNRRGPVAYITAMANLSRRAGHRTAVLQEYHHRLKRHLGQRYRLDPTLPDEKFITQLAEYDQNLDQEALATLLQQLSRKKVSEHDMVQIAAQATEWIK
jgi:hypothetical protein